MPAKRSSHGRGRNLSPPLWVVGALVLLVAALAVTRLKLLPKPKPGPPPAPPAVAKSREPATAKPKTPKLPARGPKRPTPRVPSPAPRPVPPPLQGTLPPEVNGIALVLDDVGLRMDLVEEAAAVLPKEVTFAVIPFQPASESSARFLHERGFPVILHLPMEPEDNGWRATPGSLLVGMPPDEVSRILDQDLKGVPFAEGVNNHMGSRATGDAELMDAVMADLKARGLYFLDSRTTTRTVAYDTARAHAVPSAYRAVFLDAEDATSAIIESMDHLMSRWEREGTVVAIGHLRPSTVALLAREVPKWREKGVRLLPLREVVR